MKDLKVFAGFNDELYKEITQLLTLNNFRYVLWTIVFLRFKLLVVFFLTRMVNLIGVNYAETMLSSLLMQM